MAEGDVARKRALLLAEQVADAQHEGAGRQFGIDAQAGLDGIDRETVASLAAAGSCGPSTMRADAEVASRLTAGPAVIRAERRLSRYAAARRA